MLIDQSNNYNAFNGLSGDYDKFRPHYPDVCFEIIKEIINLYNEGSCENIKILDVGCGTGICTSMLRDKFEKKGTIYGIDTSTDMLGVAKKKGKDIVYALGYAEDFSKDYKELNCVVTAQAIQWFDRDKFYDQVHRSLVSGGALCVLQNNRDWKNSSFLDAYESFIEENNTGYNRGYRDIDVISELNKFNKFENKVYLNYSWKNYISFDEFLGMSISSTKIKKIVDKIGFEAYKNKLLKLCSKYMVNDKIELLYNTELFVFIKR